MTVFKWTAYTRQRLKRQKDAWLTWFGGQLMVLMGTGQWNCSRISGNDDEQFCKHNKTHSIIDLKG